MIADQQDALGSGRGISSIGIVSPLIPRLSPEYRGERIV
jgi:hypothetical protein